jgi:hypothetical protein
VRVRFELATFSHLGHHSHHRLRNALPLSYRNGLVTSVFPSLPSCAGFELGGKSRPLMRHAGKASPFSQTRCHCWRIDGSNLQHKRALAANHRVITRWLRYRSRRIQHTPSRGRWQYHCIMPLRFTLDYVAKISLSRLLSPLTGCKYENIFVPDFPPCAPIPPDMDEMRATKYLDGGPILITLKADKVNAPHRASPVSREILFDLGLTTTCG